MRRLVDGDFETDSSDDLRLIGAAAYAEGPTTGVLCFVFHASDEHGVRKWRPGNPANEAKLRELAADPETIFVAHNAAFEQAIWREIMVKAFGFPPIPVERWEDTMATCAWKALPLKLEKAALALKLPLDKDMEGNRLTLGMSRINKKTGMYPERTAEKAVRIADYCAQDVAVEGALRKRIGLLSDQSPQERGIWLLDQKINQRGVRIDLDFVRQAQRVVDRATVPLLAEFRDLTGGINPGQRDKVIAWAGGNGVELDNLQKGYLETLLGEAEDADDAGYVSNASEEDDDAALLHDATLPVAVRRVLEIRQMLGSASIKKLARMRTCVGSDGRARGLLQYHAGHVGRWGGRLLQPQNFPRPDFKDAAGKYRQVDVDALVDAIMSGDPEYVETIVGCSAIEAVAYSLRHALIADPGKVFLSGDFAQIEARIVLALAGQTDKVALFAGGHDVYLDMASAIYNESITDKKDPRRQKPGKGGVLGCGFQCGPANFDQKFLGGKDFDLAFKTVGTYRKVWAPKVPPLWYGLERAALQAARSGEGEAYGVRYRHEGDWMVASLPSGWQRLWYPFPRLFRDEQFDKDAWRYSAYKGGKLSQVKAYGGLLTENAVQGLARGLLAASMMRLDRNGMPIVLTVHDEVVCEVDEDRADLSRFKALMAEPTEWSDRIGIPIAVEEWQGARYRK